MQDRTSSDTFQLQGPRAYRQGQVQSLSAQDTCHRAYRLIRRFANRDRLSTSVIVSPVIMLYATIVCHKSAVP